MKDLSKHVILFVAVACVVGGTALMCFVLQFWIGYLVLFLAAIGLGITELIRRRVASGIAVLVIATGIPSMLFFGYARDELRARRDAMPYRYTMTRKERAYLGAVAISDAQWREATGSFWATYVFFECVAKNRGSRTLCDIKVTFYLQDAQGNAIGECEGTIDDSYDHPDSWLLRKIRPNYEVKISGSLDKHEAPSAWNGKFKARVTRVKFSPHPE